MEKTKIILMIYLYLVAFVSLIFTAVGIGNFVNTSLKAYVFHEAEKRDYTMCNIQPYYPAIATKDISAADQKAQIDEMIKSYEDWQKQNTGDKCYASEREKRMVDSATMVIIALPIYLLHWAMIKKEKRKEDEIKA